MFVVNLLLTMLLVKNIVGQTDIPIGFSSIANLIKLVEGETKFMEIIKNKIKQPPMDITVHKTLQWIANEMQTGQKSVEKTGYVDYCGHPINTFALIKRWIKVTPQVLRYLQTKLIHVSPVLKSLPLPTTFDLDAACAGILRLQRIYNLPTSQVSQGVIKGVVSGHSLQPEDFELIGTIAFTIGEYNLASEWLQKVVDATNYKITELGIYFKLAQCYLEMGKHLKAVEINVKGLHLEPGNAALLSQLEILIQKVKNKTLVKNDVNWSRNLSTWQDYFEKLCRNELNPAKETESNLMCYFKPNLLPYLPYKEEVLYDEPKIVLIHDFLSDKESVLFKNKAYPLLSTSVIGNLSRSANHGYRYSKTSWLSDLDNDIETFSKRISLLTSLDTTFGIPFTKSEPFQVVNYGLGGQSEPHHDFPSDKKKKPNINNEEEMLHHHYYKINGHRIATVMMFLSDVKYGGATVFPHLDLVVPPFKNGALLWYNLKLNGNPDRRLLHGFCPVVLGQHWVAMKWIKERGQEFTRKCGLHRDTKDL